MTDDAPAYGRQLIHLLPDRELIRRTTITIKPLCGEGRADFLERLRQPPHSVKPGDEVELVIRGGEVQYAIVTRHS